MLSRIILAAAAAASIASGAVALSGSAAEAHGFGVKSGYVCPYGQTFLCFNGVCGCYRN